MKSKFIFLLLLVSVSILNVALNVFAKKIANPNITLLSQLLSIKFGALFLLGLTSLICLFQVYRSEINPSQGILLMGTFSIIFGTLFSIFILRNKISLIESIIMIFLAVLFIVRWIFVLK